MMRFHRRRRDNPEGRMSIIDHLRELRRRMIVVVLIVAAGAVIGWLFYVPILHLLEGPYCNVPAKYRFQGTGNDCALIYTAPLDGFTIRLKLSVMMGAIITSPLWLYQIWAFITPGLRKHERKWTIIFVASSSVLFAAGMVLAYFTLYKGLRAMIQLSGSGTQSLLTVTSYISFVTLVILIFGVSFELPLLVVMLNLARILPYSVLKRGQRIGIFLMFVFAAVATPTADPFTMTAMAIPMALLFEGAVLFAFIHDRRRARRALANERQALSDDEASQIDPLPTSIEPD